MATFQSPEFFVSKLLQLKALLSGRGHLMVVAKLLYIAFLSDQQIMIFSSEIATGRRLYESEALQRPYTSPIKPDTAQCHVYTTCSIYRKGKWLDLLATTPHPTTANNTECPNRGHLFCFVVFWRWFVHFSSLHMHIFQQAFCYIKSIK